jgi:hypothetical protein
MPSIGREDRKRGDRKLCSIEESPFHRVAWQVREGDSLGASLPWISLTATHGGNGRIYPHDPSLKEHPMHWVIALAPWGETNS